MRNCFFFANRIAALSIKRKHMKSMIKYLSICQNLLAFYDKKGENYLEFIAFQIYSKKTCSLETSEALKEFLNLPVDTRA